MHKRMSLDTCDIFLSRRSVRSHFPTHQRAASELPPALRAENLMIAPYFNLFVQRPLEVPELPGTVLAASAGTTSAKPLPLPGSSGSAQPKPTRLANGRRHVPRPRNPFILFRCDLVHQRKMLPRSDMDDTNISRIAGDLWREMTAAQKQPWVELAAEEKARHALLYPDYKYAPTHGGGSKGKKTKDDSPVEERPMRQVFRMGAGPAAGSSLDHPPQRSSRHQAERPERPRPYPQPQCIPRRRSSSCPPVGAVPVPSQSPVDEWTPPLVTRDDLERRPSRTIMYHSVASQPAQVVDEPTAPTPSIYDHPLPPPEYEYNWLGLSQQVDPLLINPSTYPLLDVSQSQSPESPDSYTGPNNFAFFDHNNKPTVIPGTHDPCCFTTQELAELERLTLGTTFIDPFSALPVPTDNESSFAFPGAISPFDCCSGYSTSSPSSTTSGASFN